MRLILTFMFVAFLANGFEMGLYVYGFSSRAKASVEMTSMDCCPKPQKTSKVMDMTCHACCLGVMAMHVSPPAPYETDNAYGPIILTGLSGQTLNGIFRPPRFS